MAFVTAARIPIRFAAVSVMMHCFAIARSLLGLNISGKMNISGNVTVSLT
jgi:hypothetical protein